MANTKISALPAGAPAVATDILPIDRAGVNNSLQVSDVLNALSGAVTLTTPASAANGGTGQIQPFEGHLILPGLVTTPMTPATTVVGDNDLYTVPANKRALLIASVYNPNLLQATYFPEAKIGGAYYHVNNASTPAVNVVAAINFSIVLEAGQSFAVNAALGTALALSQVASSAGTTTYTGTITGGGSNALAGHSVTIAGFTTGGNNGTFLVLTSSATTFTVATTTQGNETHAATWQDQTGLNIWGVVILFNNTAALKSAVLTTFVNGNNALYTCPGGKTAYVAGYQGEYGAGATSSSAFYVNQSGSNRVVSMNVVPNGGSVGLGNQFAKNLAAGNNVLVNGQICTTFAAGDSVNVNTDSNSAAQIAWVDLFEM